ncbi:hypothetical protein KKB71_00365 [Patescibacteria group bacterium]|nr:hypothetical protein [Patescibacteria group bacterium]MBU2218956.1 hypothetical protein [Patescibacteria group bacterium]
MVFLPIIVSARIVPCGCMGDRDAEGKCTNEVPCTICHLAVGIKNIIDVLLTDIAFPLTVIAFLYGGIMLITSRGSEQNLEKGKKAIWMAFWGILIAFGAWLLIDLILGNLISKDVIHYPWNAFPGC